MRKPKMSVLVGGVSYSVRLGVRVLKAEMNGYYGWVSVWADDSEELKRRIRRVRSGGQ
jgi:hypothetical protein